MTPFGSAGGDHVSVTEVLVLFGAVRFVGGSEAGEKEGKRGEEEEEEE